MNKLVARYADGRLLKGTTLDFSADKDIFHITPPPPDPGWDRTEVSLSELKALFYVKDFDGDPGRVKNSSFDASPPAWEHRVEVTFKDGEVLRGTTPRYHSAHGGFFLVPADGASNNVYCYVVEAATSEVHFM